MKHDATIPFDLHVRAAASVKDSLGTFWSSVFRDQDLVDAVTEAKALSASQLHVTAMEDLSLRDHTELPLYHREHWHPLFIRLSQRNMRRGLTVGMDSAVIGEQTSSATPYVIGEVFEVGENSDVSKVNTYPFVSMNGCPLVRVLTCICDSITAPKHILTQGRDFDVADGILTVRKEQDPFDRGGYRVVEVEGDRVAVLWVCDGEYDTNNVADFLAYPMGFDVESTGTSKRLLSAYWDAVVYGLTPRYLNIMLGALYDIPTAESDETVESVEDDGADRIVVTDRRAYRIAKARVRNDIGVGTALQAGDFLTKEIKVYHSFSEAEFAYLADHGAFTPAVLPKGDNGRPRIVLPAGSVLGVSVPVRIESFDTSSLRQETDGDALVGAWFPLSEGDGYDSPFWRAVSDPAAVVDLFSRLPKTGEGTVNPLKTVGYSALANTVVVVTDRQLVDVPYARQLFSALQALMPGYASLLTVQQAVSGT